MVVPVSLRKELLEEGNCRIPRLVRPYKVEVQDAEGGHGGETPALLRDLFGEPQRIP